MYQWLGAMGAKPMAEASYTWKMSWPEQQRSHNDDDAEQMKVLSALLGCLIVAEQADSDRSMFSRMLDGAKLTRPAA
jgi:hypothetical protein